MKNVPPQDRMLLYSVFLSLSFTELSLLINLPIQPFIVRERLKVGGEGMTEDEMARWHH
jgi:hypothetical protein